MPASVTDLLYLGTVALTIGVPYHTISRLCISGKIDYLKLGHQRVIRAGDVEKIRQTCIEHGYVKSAAAAGK